MQPSSRPWFIRHSRPVLVAGVGLIAIAAIGVSVLILRTRDAADWVSHTLEVRDVAQSLALEITEAESASRGYVLAGDPLYLARYDRALPLVGGNLDRLRRLTADNPEEQQRLAALKPLIDEKLGRIAGTIELVRAGKRDELMNAVGTGRGEALMIQIGAQLTDLRQTEENLLVARQNDYTMLQTWLAVLIALCLGGAIALAGGLGFTTQYYIRRLRERTLQLEAEAALRAQTEETLRQSQKLEAVGQLTGGIAHDFNNLLTIIMGNLDTLKRRLAAPANAAAAAQFAGPVDVALQGARSAAQLTHRLLAYARRQPLAPVPCDLNRLVSSMSDLLRRTLGETINVETVLAGGLWHTFVDPNQVENALLNLTINARDAMPEGGRLTIETANIYLDDAYAARFGDVKAGQYALLSVTDTGSGIPPDVMEKVFEPFFTTKGHGEGSGLGLSMVHGFVKQSGGHVRIYSEVGEGTSVKIYLPREQAPEETTSTPAERVIAPVAPAFVANPGETILVVEDNAGVRQYASEILTELGYSVYEASTAAAALAILNVMPRVDLLFTDVVLPGGTNGRELASRVGERLPNLPVLFTTGYTRNAIVHHGRLDANVNLLGKPYTQGDLARKVREILNARPSPLAGD